MSNKIGTLGKSTTNVAAGTYTFYQCPTAKAAKFRVMMQGQNAGGATPTFTLTINGMVVLVTAAITASHYIWTDAGTIRTGAALPVATGTIVGPLGIDFYLGALELAQFTISAAGPFTSLVIAAVGTEVDV